MAVMMNIIIIWDPKLMLSFQLPLKVLSFSSHMIVY